VVAAEEEAEEEAEQEPLLAQELALASAQRDTDAEKIVFNHNTKVHT
jgi:hypothetical protein